MHPTTDGFKLLVFDWDGTLVDSIWRIVRCTQEALRRLRLPPVEDDRIRTAIGLGIRETVDRIYPGCSDELFARICDAYRQLWLETYSRDPVLFPGVEAALDELGRQGYLMAVATAKNRLGLTRDLENTGLVGHFHTSRTVDEAPPKPHPQMLLGILHELDVREHDALMIGDSVHDLQMARNAGVPAVGVTTGSHVREELIRVEALDYLAGVNQLPRWLSERSAT